LDLFTDKIGRSLDVLFLNFGDREAMVSLKLITKLRKAGVKADLYPESSKMQKQMKYANKRNVPYVVLIGDRELADNSFVVKNMAKGDQKTHDSANIEGFLQELKLFLD
jgi:histidyl-tRNA synthetase